MARRATKATRKGFGYFVLQARTELGQDGVHVLLEDLGTGEKVSFSSADELGRYLNRWGRPEPDST